MAHIQSWPRLWPGIRARNRWYWISGVSSLDCYFSPHTWAFLLRAPNWFSLQSTARDKTTQRTKEKKILLHEENKKKTQVLELIPTFLFLSFPNAATKNFDDRLLWMSIIFFFLTTYSWVPNNCIHTQKCFLFFFSNLYIFSPK